MEVCSLFIDLIIVCNSKKKQIKIFSAICVYSNMFDFRFNFTLQLFGLILSKCKTSWEGERDYWFNESLLLFNTVQCAIESDKEKVERIFGWYISGTENRTNTIGNWNKRSWKRSVVKVRNLKKIYLLPPILLKSNGKILP